MDFQKLFLSAEGRIGRGEFWAGWCILFVINLVVHFVPGLGQLIALVLIYPWVCVYTKRLHDMGKSGWLQLIPIVVFLAAIIIGVIAGGTAAIMGAMSGHSDADAGMAALGGFGLFFILLCLALLVSLVFLLWVGVSPTQPGANRYGPEPGTTDPLPPPAAV